MNFDINPQEKEWLKCFFSNKNVVNWDDIEKENITANQSNQILPWLRFIGDLDKPIVLPFKNEQGGIQWYAAAHDDRVFSQLTNEIKSFIGETYSDCSGRPCSLDLSEIHENALNERFENRVIRFSATDDESIISIEGLLDQYNKLLTRRPEIKDRTQRPFGAIRRDFDMALRAGNASNAEKYFDELFNTGRVDAVQCKFLEIRKLAGLGLKEELARDYSLLLNIADLSLPTQTLVDVIDALYETYFRSNESELETSELVDLFREKIPRPIQPLFKERKGICHPTVLRAFLLSELVQENPNEHRCKSILASYEDSAEGKDLANKWFKDYFDSLLVSEGHEGTTPIKDKDVVGQALLDEDYETVYVLCLNLIPEYWAYSSLLRIVRELGDIEKKENILQIIEESSSQVREQLSERDNQRFASLRDSLSDGVTSITRNSGWLGWVRNVSEGRVKGIDSLVNTMPKWSVDQYASNFDLCNELATIMGNADADAENIYRQAFPLLADFFSTDNPSRSFLPIFSTLLKILGWSGSLSGDELEVALDISKKILLRGPHLAEYTECLEDLKEIVGANNSYIHFNWALNLAETLFLYPSQNKSLRLNIFLSIVDLARANERSLTPVQESVLSYLIKDYRCEEVKLSFVNNLESEIVTDKNLIDLKGKRLAIYTLMEGAGKRAKELLELGYPGLEIKLNHDKSATTALLELARSADFFIFSAKTAAHQAFYPVKETRKGMRHPDMIYPAGKGTSSIVSRFSEFVSREYIQPSVAG